MEMAFLIILTMMMMVMESQMIKRVSSAQATESYVESGKVFFDSLIDFIFRHAQIHVQSILVFAKPKGPGKLTFLEQYFFKGSHPFHFISLVA